MWGYTGLRLLVGLGLAGLEASWQQPAGAGSPRAAGGGAAESSPYVWDLTIIGSEV